MYIEFQLFKSIQQTFAYKPNFFAVDRMAPNIDFINIFQFQFAIKLYVSGSTSYMHHFNHNVRFPQLGT